MCERQPDSDAPFAGVRVLDLGGAPSAYATRVLRILGADVVLIEPPGGGTLRRQPPFVGSSFESVAFGHFAIGKRSVCIDLHTRDGRAVFSALCDTADVVVIDQETPTRDDIRALVSRSSVILAGFRDVAVESPWGGFVGSNLVDEALSGLLSLTGAEGRPPTQLGGDQTWHQLSLHGLVAIEAALYGRRAGRLPADEPLVIETNAQEAAAMSTLQIGNVHYYLWHGTVPRRPYAPVQEGVASRQTPASGLVRCADGYAVFGIPIPGDWDQFLAWLADRDVDLPEPLRRPEFYATEYRLAHRDEVNAVVDEVAGRSQADEFCESAQRFGLLAMPVYRPLQLASDRHLQERAAFFEHPLSAAAGHTGLDTGAPFWSSPELTAIDPAVPSIGQHTAAIIAGLPGYSTTDIPLLIACGAIRVG